MADVRPVTKIEGPDASDAPITQNPLLIGGRASDAVVTPVSADNDQVALWVSRRGAAFTAELPHIALDGSPFTQVNKNVQLGGTQTGTAIWTPAGGKKILVMSYELTVAGTVAADSVLWFGASGDTTFSVGADFSVFYGNFIPSASISPGVSRSGVWLSPTADHVLRYTTAGANNATISVWGYEF
jgi:hypothetical protein